MKKTLVFYAFIVFSLGFSQCYIEGNSSMKVSEIDTYSVTNANAECADCHSWEITGENAVFEGDVKQSSVKVLPKKGGNFILTATLNSAKGNKKCSKIIEVLNNVALEPNTVSPNCDIKWIDYKNLKKSDGMVAFESAEKNDKNKFEWTVTYENGDQKTSTSENPQFNFSAENGIKTVSTKISTAKCTRTFTKNYETNFWKFF